MKFSIVIPVYKAEEYLDQCVQSVVQQTYRELEVILVDDGSPDRCGVMCDDWAKKDDRILVIHQKNLGASSARNNGIHYASGDYLLFLDSDDWWENSTVLERIAKQLNRTPVDALTFNYRKSYGDVLQPSYFSEKLSASQMPESLEQIMEKNVWVSGACNKAIARRLLIDNDLYFRVGITSEDIDWALRVAIKAESFAFSDVCVFVYRQRSESSSHSVSLAKMKTLCDNIHICVQLLEQTDPVKTEVLKSYVAYQYGTMIYNAANLPRTKRQCLMSEIRQMRYLLAYSHNPKVRLIERCSRVLGISVTLLLLRLRYQLKKFSCNGGPF